MLTSPPSDQEPAHAADVVELLSALIDRSLVDVDAALLADMVVDDPRALAEYCEIIDLECLLALEFKSRAAPPVYRESTDVP